MLTSEQCGLKVPTMRCLFSSRKLSVVTGIIVIRSTFSSPNLFELLIVFGESMLKYVIEYSYIIL